MKTQIAIDTVSFDWIQAQEWLQSDPEDGAIVTFWGKVRSIGGDMRSLYLEHYSGMTESVLIRIADKTRMRWKINKIFIFHRVGKIQSNENIVFVGVSSAHRAEAFAAAEYIMDTVKTEAPFWKKEQTQYTTKWVNAKFSDYEALKKWN